MALRRPFIVALAILAAVGVVAFGLRLSQIEFNLSAPAGTSESGTFVVINEETEPTTVNVTVADWDRLPDGESRFLPSGSLDRSASGWITVAPAQFTLQPDEAIEVHFSLEVPSGIQGTHWTSLLVEGTPREVETQQGTTILVRRRFAVKVLETPPGSGEPQGKIKDLQVRGLNPMTAVIQFENTGAVNLPAVKGRVEVRNTSGQTIESIPIEEFPVLPGAVRVLRPASARAPGEGLAPGRYLILVVLDYGGSNLLGGQLVLDIKPLELVPLGDAASASRDLDGDGVYEDVNGDGAFNAADPILLGFEIDSPGVQNNVRAFDFDNDGDADFDDVTALRERLEQGTS